MVAAECVSSLVNLLVHLWRPVYDSDAPLYVGGRGIVRLGRSLQQSWADSHCLYRHLPLCALTFEFDPVSHWGRKWGCLTVLLSAPARRYLDPTARFAIKRLSL